MRISISSLIVVLLTALSTPVHGADKPRAPLGEVLSGEAKTLYEDGRLLVEGGDFKGALVKFRSAYSISREPRLLWNIAVCERNLHHYANLESALELYRQVGALPPSEAKTVDEVLAEAKSFVGTITFDLQPASATILVDGQAPTGLHPSGSFLTLRVDLGSHLIEVKSEGFETLTKSVEIRGGDTLPLVADLKEIPKTGRLIVSTSKENTIKVDDALVSGSHYDGKLPIGNHTITVTGSVDKIPFESRITLTIDSVRALDVRLDSKPPSYAWVWWVVGGVGLATGVGIGAYFLLHKSPGPTEGTLGVTTTPMVRF